MAPGQRPDPALFDSIDASDHYRSLDLDPDKNFNLDEITLSHLFRFPSHALRGRNFSECLLSWLNREGIPTRRVTEVGAGLGHVAFNLLQAAGEPAIEYRILDISPRLIEAQRRLLGDRVSFECGDARRMPGSDRSFQGLILSIGMLADLHSIRIDPRTGSPVQNGRAALEPRFLRALNGGFADERPAYLHIGALEFIEELHRVMSPGSHAVVAEYRWTPRNSAVHFKTHWECGIQFGQLSRFAANLGFDVREFDMQQVLGLDPDTRLLSMDLFTRAGWEGWADPEIARHRSVLKRLGVRGYTSEELRIELSGEDADIEPVLLARLIQAMGPWFRPLDDPAFDSVNPETWHYRFLHLRR